jgi:spore maturation protein CgeB
MCRHEPSRSACRPSSGSVLLPKRNKRVFVIGPHGHGQLPASFAAAFEQCGFEATRFDSDVAYFNAGWCARHRLTRRLFRRSIWDSMNVDTLARVGESRPDLVLAVKGTYLHPGTIRAIRTRFGIPIVNYYSDNPYCGLPWNPRKSSIQRPDLIAALREYTKVWIWDRAMAHHLRRDGVEASYLPFGVDPQLSQVDSASGCVQCGIPHPVVFIGQHSDKREAHVAAVRRHAVALWGNRWTRRARAIAGRHVIHAGAAFGPQCTQLYASASVSLNIVDDLNMPGHNMRTFEIPASGGLMLSTYTAEQAELFPEGDAALYYRQPSEIDERLDEALSNGDRMRRLKTRAYQIAHEHHYVRRATSMLAELGA